MGMGSSRKSNGPRGLVADINVTPLVDVMLVLLIIFMVTAPMMTQGLDVKLPETTTAKPLPQKEETLVVTVKKNGKISLGKIEYSQAVLQDLLTKKNEKDKEEIILLGADKDVSYGELVEVMDAIKKAGFKKLGMVTNPVEEKP